MEQVKMFSSNHIFLKQDIMDPLTLQFLHPRGHFLYVPCYRQWCLLGCVYSALLQASIPQTGYIPQKVTYTTFPEICRTDEILLETSAVLVNTTAPRNEQWFKIKVK